MYIQQTGFDQNIDRYASRRPKPAERPVAVECVVCGELGTDQDPCIASARNDQGMRPTRALTASLVAPVLDCAISVI